MERHNVACMHSGILVLKRQRIEPGYTWVNVEDIMLSDTGQSRSRTNAVRVHLFGVPGIFEFTETECGWGLSGVGGKEDGELRLNVSGGPALKDGENSGDGC